MKNRVNKVRTKAGQTQETRQRIVGAALELLNDQGVGSVTTHDIASAVGISPGNLYYHFKNKEEIIRELFSQIISALEATFASVAESSEKSAFADFMKDFFDSIWQYRFFSRDFSPILRNDPELAVEWKRKLRQMTLIMKSVALKWVDSGDMQKFSSEEALEAFLDNIFTVIYFGGVYHEAKHTANSKKSFKQVIDRTVEFLIPYHTPKGQQAVRRFKAQFQAK